MMTGTSDLNWLSTKLQTGQTVILDGAMGTELEARGVPMHQNAWSAAALLTHPEMVRDTHIDYIRAGAEVIITNTFSAGRHMLEPAGLGKHVAEINKRAVQVAREAVEQANAGPVAIAGSMCEWVNLESKWKDPAHLKTSLEEHANLLAEAGVDFIAVEMCERVVESPMAVEAVLQTGIPVWAGLSCRRDSAHKELRTFDAPGRPYEDVVKRIAECDLAVMNVMHSPIADVPEAIQIVRKYWSGPLGVYPEAGYFKMPNWQFVDTIEPEDLVREARGWMDLGATLIGGCCGLGVDHVKALKQAFG